MFISQNQNSINAVLNVHHQTTPCTPVAHCWWNEENSSYQKYFI